MMTRNSVRSVLIVWCVVFVLAGCTPAPATSGRLKVSASFYVLADFAGKIGGDRIDLVNLMPPGAEPHDWEPGSADIVRLEQSDVLIYNGAGLEHWVEAVIASLSNKKLILVEASTGIELLAGGHDHEHEHEDEHEDEHEHEGETDPHVWLSPRNAKIQMQMILKALQDADPQNSAYYQANYDVQAARLDELDQEFRSALATVSRREIIVAHAAFAYLCAEYDLTQVAVEGLSPDADPDPARMAEIVVFAREHDVTVIFFESLASPKVAQTIAAEIGARTAVLNPLEGLDSSQLAKGDDYFSIMRENLAALLDALS